MIHVYYLFLHETALQKRKKSMAMKKSIELGGMEASDSLMQRSPTTMESILKLQVT